MVSDRVVLRVGNVNDGYVVVKEAVPETASVVDRSDVERGAVRRGVLDVTKVLIMGYFLLRG